MRLRGSGRGLLAGEVSGSPGPIAGVGGVPGGGELRGLGGTQASG